MAANDLIIVKAKITMKTTVEGGRISGFKSGYRPNHVFELPSDLRNLKTYIGDIQFDDQELIASGETKIVLMSCFVSSITTCTVEFPEYSMVLR